MAGRGDFPPSGFGSRARGLREGAGLTQKQLAEAVGLHPNTLAKLERGEHEPAWPIVLKIAAALGVSCEAFNAQDVAPAAATEPAPPPEPPRPAGKRK